MLSGDRIVAPLRLELVSKSLAKYKFVSSVRHNFVSVQLHAFFYMKLRISGSNEGFVKLSDFVVWSSQSFVKADFHSVEFSDWAGNPLLTC